MTEEEYLYLTGGLDGIDPVRYHDVGHDVFENGWIDVFGLITPKGDKAMEGYLNDQGQ